MIDCKSPSQIKVMRQGGAELSKILKKIINHAKPGVSTQMLNRLAHQLIIQSGGKPSFLNYQGYPASICVSINDEVVHGLPSPRLLEIGDIIGLDIGMLYRGFHTDMAQTVGICKISPDKNRLINVTKHALEIGIQTIKPNIHLGDVSAAIGKVIKSANLGIVRELSGHGIGKKLQEYPPIPNFGTPGKGPILRPGMTLALEPMVTLGKPDIKILSDNWTIVTTDHQPSAHFEKTVVVTTNGVDILTP